MRHASRFPALLVLIVVTESRAQLAPEIGYVYPPGGKAGTTIKVHLGGAEWTPDMQFFVHDPRVRLEVLGPPGELLIPPPPYWFGAKGRLSAMPLLREVPARITLPADLPPGPIRWQAANANGATSAGIFIVSDGNEVVEDEKRKGPQTLPSIPVTVSGRLLKNEEVDRYRFIATKTGPITCELAARRLGSNFNGVIEIFDAKHRPVADAVDTEGLDPILTFAAVAGAEYTIAVHDIDYAGDRSFTYRLNIRQGPRVVGTIPAVGRRGETREVEFVGIGIVTGLAKLESFRRRVTFPSGDADFFVYQLETPWGTAPFAFPLGDMLEGIAAAGTQPFPVTLPGAVTGVLDESKAEARFALSGKKGDRWSIIAEARRFGSPLDMTLRLLGPDGKEIARNGDLPGTSDAGLDVALPADGSYQIAVGDSAGASGSRAAIYRLSIRPQADGFVLHVPTQKFSALLGQKTPLVIKAARTGNFKGPIALTFAGLPAGVSVPANIIIPADRTELSVALDVAADAASTASLFTIAGSADVNGKRMSRPALAPTTMNLAPRSPEENQTSKLLLAIVMKPRVKGEPVDKDTGRKVPRGSTHPADISIHRLEGYAGEIMLRQASRQSYQVQGITGRDITVPAAATKAVYPCFMPEWLETTRTSRMGIVSEVKIPDPKGNLRTLVAPIGGFVTMTMEGALLKLSHQDEELSVRPGEAFMVRVRIARSARLVGPVRLELRLPDELAGTMKAEPTVVPADQSVAELQIVTTADIRLTDDRVIVLRGTAVQPGSLPVVSETAVGVSFTPAKR
jgi:hypothetical protein